MKVHFIQHVIFEHPAYLTDWAKQQQHEISFTKTFEEIKFPSHEEFDMLIIMGGPMGVYEEEKYVWLKKEKQFIKTTIDAGKKVLGICLGSQLVAAALGAKVYQHTKKEIGWWPVKKVKENILTQNLPDEFIVFHWHGDTFDLPEGAEHLFCSKACTHQGFALGENVLALQFHTEATSPSINDMLQNDNEEFIKSEYVQAKTFIQQSAEKYTSKQNEYLQILLKNFLKNKLCNTNY